MQTELPEGFIIPVRRSLTEPILMGGVPRTADPQFMEVLIRHIKHKGYLS